MVSAEIAEGSSVSGDTVKTG